MADDRRAALRLAATLMRDEHGPEHERHKMWATMSDLLFMAADHARGQGNPCDSCVSKAGEVARAYLAATPSEHSGIGQPLTEGERNRWRVIAPGGGES